MLMRRLAVALIGTNFMGRAHSNAWSQVAKFFPSPVEPRLAIACGRERERTDTFARRWGWTESAVDWRAVVERPDIDVVDISVPTHLHRDIAVAAARAGKHVFCEKPLATSAEEAGEMLEAAKRSGVVHAVNHNYRRVPAVMQAKRLIDEGRLGRIFHWRGAYQQDWIVDPAFPLTWHLRRETAGSGPHADLNSHSVDLAQFLVGPIATVSCMTTTFVKRRPLPGAGSATFSAGAAAAEMGEVTVEDASLMQVEFENGALGSFEATRFATGRKNRNAFEIYGSAGALAFDLERLNELEFYDGSDASDRRGFRTVLATESEHPYIARWWPPGHLIGYEHTFVHAVADFVEAVRGKVPATPDFADGLRTMAVLDAGLRSAASGRRERVERPALATTGAEP
jgi:predicted dehydrogenase